MKFHFDFVSNNEYTVDNTLPEEVLSAATIRPEALHDRVPSPKAFVVALPDVQLTTDKVLTENVVTVLYEPVNFDVRTVENARLIAQLVMSKAIACDHTTWKSLHCAMSTNKRWIDLTGVSVLPKESEFGEVHAIHYYGKANSFTNFLQTVVEDPQSPFTSLSVYEDGDVEHDATARKHAVAFTSDTRSRLFMDTLSNVYSLVVYPLTGNNEAHVCAVDCRGASATMASVKSLDDSGLGGTAATTTKWREMLTEVKYLLKSVNTLGRLIGPRESLCHRLFHEINRSGF